VRVSSSSLSKTMRSSSEDCPEVTSLRLFARVLHGPGVDMQAQGNKG
jgi:hypothetical protein